MARDIYDEAQRLLKHARKPQELEDAERKVIEAAKAWHIVHGRKYDRKLWDGHEDELGRAVEALQEVEGE